MRLPRDLSGAELAKALRRFGYEVSRQTGSHIRLTTQQGGEHHVTIPAASALRVGTLAAVVAEVARHLEVSSDEVARRVVEARR
ncbi:MAG: type II toxin-antitoxin system HicA family toxin [Thermoanaerobaculales bacterium]